VSGKSPLKMQPEILPIIFLGELNIVYMDQEARFSSCSDCDVDRLGSNSFNSPFSIHLDCK
jgi:hypothetical protein